MNRRMIYEVQLLDLLPENLRQDPDIIAASKAIDTGFMAIVDEVKNVLIYPRKDELESDVLDHVAYFFHVDFYSRSLDIATKRKLVKESVYTHQIKGTPGAIEDVVTAIYPGAKITEWFDYNGQPFHFRIEVDSSVGIDNNIDRLHKMINSVKRKSTILDAIKFNMTVPSIETFFGAVITTPIINFAPVGTKMNLVQLADANVATDETFFGAVTTTVITNFAPVGTKMNLVQLADANVITDETFFGSITTNAITNFK